VPIQITSRAVGITTAKGGNAISEAVG